MNLVGMMWNKNEADLLPFTIPAAMEQVDALFIADDGSTDPSWEIIQSFRAKNKDKIVHIQREPNKNDPGQRQSLLNKIKKRFPFDEKTWIQIFESDIMVIDTDIRQAIKDQVVKDIAVSWHLLNAARKPGTWGAADTWPIWEEDIKQVMPYFHWLEPMLYTFKLLPGLYYEASPWRPWPRGFSKYVPGAVMRTSMRPESPILGHYGFRGPTHFFAKYQAMGAHHKRHPTWKLGSVAEVEKTVPFFNGVWNRDMQLLNREGWKAFVRNRPW
jgi:glycosyltransferase involved in cell wall biosynthesis